jgi:hypothetical protein
LNLLEKEKAFKEFLFENLVIWNQNSGPILEKMTFWGKLFEGLFAV